MSTRLRIVAILAVGLIPSFAVGFEDEDKRDSDKDRNESRQERRSDESGDNRRRENDSRKNDSRDDERRENDDRTDSRNDRESNSERPRSRIRLGVLLGRSTTTGARVHQVAPGSAAARAGLKPGDYILKIGDQQVESPADVGRYMESTEPDESISLSVWNNNQTRDLRVTVRESDSGAAGLDPQTSGFGPRGAEVPLDLPRDGITQAGGVQNGSAQSSTPSNRAGSRAWLGIAPADRGSELGQQSAEGEQQNRGVVVRSVYPGSPAEKAGLRNGDQVVRFDGKDVTRANDIFSAMNDLDPDDEIEIEFTRGGESQTLTIKLEDRSRTFGQTGQAGQFGQATPTSRFGIPGTEANGRFATPVPQTQQPTRSQPPLQALPGQPPSAQIRRGAPSQQPPQPQPPQSRQNQ